MKIGKNNTSQSNEMETKKNQSIAKHNASATSLTSSTENPLVKHLQGDKRKSIRSLAVSDQDALKKKVLNVFGLVTVYHPDFAEQASNQYVLDEFIRALAQRYPDFLIDELDYVFRRELISYKTYGSLKLTDLFLILDGYMEERAIIRERNHHNAKQKHLKESTEELPNVDYSALKMRLREESERKKPKREQIERDQIRIQTHDPDLTFEKWMEQQNPKP